MAQYYTLPTAIGEAKIANAIALGGTITISELAVGDGGGTTPVPDSDRVALVNEVRRAPINTSVVDPDNPSWIVVEQVLPPDIGGWTIREIGLFDDDGDLIAYGNYPETYKPVLSEGSGRTQTIRFVMQVSDTAAVTLKVDPSVVLATRSYVDDSLAEHAASRNHPDATTTAKGMMQYATQQEHLDGQRTDRAAKPSGVRAMIDAAMAKVLSLSGGRLNGPLGVDEGGDISLYASEQSPDDPGDIVYRAFDGTIKERLYWSVGERYLTTLGGQVWDRGNNDLVGSVAAYATPAIPAGWLKCNGAAVSRSVYTRLFSVIGTRFGAGDGSTTFNLPDLRGEFVRGWDDARGIDGGRVFGGWQEDMLESHDHGITLTAADDFNSGTRITSSDTSNGTTNTRTNSAGGHETRPRNVALLYCIKY